MLSKNNPEEETISCLKQPQHSEAAAAGLRAGDKAAPGGSAATFCWVLAQKLGRLPPEGGDEAYKPELRALLLLGPWLLPIVLSPLPRDPVPAEARQGLL